MLTTPTPSPPVRQRDPHGRRAAIGHNGGPEIDDYEGPAVYAWSRQRKDGHVRWSLAGPGGEIASVTYDTSFSRKAPWRGSVAMEGKTWWVVTGGPQRARACVMRWLCAHTVAWADRNCVLAQGSLA